MIPIKSFFKMLICPYDIFKPCLLQCVNTDIQNTDIYIILLLGKHSPQPTCKRNTDLI